MSDSSGRTRSRVHSYLLGAGILVLVVVLGFVLRTPGASSPGAATESDAATTEAVTTEGVTPGAVADGVKTFGWPSTATDEEFCEGWRRVAESQAEFAGTGDAGAEELEEAADQLVGSGVPTAMSLPGRSGYFAVIGGVYDDLGFGLEAEAVGAPLDPVDGGDAAFSDYLARNCPA